MKKLLLFTLIIGLFSGCKKTEETPSTLYVGQWGNNQVLCTQLPAKNIPHHVRLNFLANGTGEIKAINGCDLPDYNSVLTFNYTVVDNTFLLTNQSYSLDGKKLTPTENNYAKYYYGIVQLPFKMIDAKTLQILGDGIGNNPNGNGYSGVKNTFTKL
jgi:hypothetical protein